MNQVAASGLDSTHSFFCDLYKSRDFFSKALESSLFETSPRSRIRYNALAHFMHLLCELATQQEVRQPLLKDCQHVVAEIRRTAASEVCHVTFLIEIRNENFNIHSAEFTAPDSTPVVITFEPQSGGITLSVEAATLRFIETTLPSSFSEFLQKQQEEEEEMVHPVTTCASVSAPAESLSSLSDALTKPVSGESPVLHRFSDTSICHYGVDGSLIRGFVLTKSSPPQILAQGFLAHADQIKDDADPVVKFSQMLKSKLFCCELCSSAKWFDGHSFPSIIPSYPVSRSNERTFAVQYRKAHVVKSVTFQGDSPRFNDAHYCLSMLGAFFGLSLDIGSARVSLINSVQCDCKLGRISHTLAFLKPEPSGAV
jgi:hypothetical protein